MKWLALPVLAVLVSVGTGCAKSDQNVNADTPASLQNLARQCVTDRQRLIRRAWNDYELRQRRTVVFPDWRRKAITWARVECAHGRAIEQFRP